jgi:ABC-type nitrate/sulfonate/bicarbonate transport system substrate-binding protein
MSLSKIRIGGVPEHFNMPVHLAIENGEFSRRGLDVEWTNFNGGTGQMTKALREGEIDVCILLTEGIIADIIKGNPSKIISEYVITPLTWGIHTAAENKLKHHNEIYDKRYAISRFGSGSHLMAIVDANLEGKKIDTEQFNVIKNLDGALDSLAKNETDVFYWEKYTTKPWVDKGDLKRVGEFITPWPCFMIAATNNILEEQPENIIRLLRVIHDSCDSFMQSEYAIKIVSERMNQKPEDVARWFHSTEWSIHGWVSEKMLKSVMYYLKAADIVADNATTEDLVWVRKK